LTNIVELKYSRKDIGRAGDMLSTKDILSQDYNESLEKLSNWRASHVYPLQIIQQLLKKRAKKIDKSSLVAQRLKRTPSIINKLKRYSSMKLHRLQDIGGCRAILENIDKVYKLRDNIMNNFSAHSFVKENDYIKEMKDSGYRGIHLIYKFNSQSNIEFNKHLIEIQLRTKLQHSWATSVEILGTYYNEALKSSQGSKEVLDFFKQISLLFFYAENNKLDLNPESLLALKKSILKDIEELDLITKLRAFSVTTNSISQRNKKDGYTLLILDTNKMVVKIRYFDKNEMEMAIQEYLKLEKESGNMNSDNIVLVSTQSIHNLKKTYPNYFADSNVFIENLEEFTR
jgi:ppGpp synthetase/RelA/SpoT-type nucleotidyltranferase